jgi:SAM-dependent methyltransferase
VHDTAYKIGKLFFDLYWRPEFNHIVEFGSCNVNGSLRDFRPPPAAYTGLDLADGPGVDIRVKPFEKLPLEDHSADIVLSTSAFEHDPCFWETFLELARIVKPGGFIYINAPSNGAFHRCPLDCWRFYPDAGEALASWACRKGQDIQLVESCVAERQNDIWNDFNAIFHKRNSRPLVMPVFLTDSIACTNIRRFDRQAIVRGREESEDMVIIRSQRDKLAQMNPV